MLVMTVMVYIRDGTVEKWPGSVVDCDVPFPSDTSSLPSFVTKPAHTTHACS